MAAQIDQDHEFFANVLALDRHNPWMNPPTVQFVELLYARVHFQVYLFSGGFRAESQQPADKSMHNILGLADQLNRQLPIPMIEHALLMALP
jgi:hypothetical protein